MLFNSLTFVAFFFVLVVAYYSLRHWKSQKILLLVASYLFYAAWNPPFVALLWISTLVDWFAAKRLEVEDGKAKRIALAVVSVVVNLGLLGFFKYGGFVLDNFVSFVAFYGISYQPAQPDIILPVGISFYTFQTMSYTLDVFHRRSHASKSFLDFALYVTFFPQLVAGPIVRATQFLPQLVAPRRANWNQFHWGLFLMTLGLFQKVVLADAMLAPSAEIVFGFKNGLLSGFDAWIGVLAFSGQIFFDFSGYSTTAIGVALCFGFSLPDNFRRPYAAIGFSDFWKRWHISLSSWLRDYFYIPLGGNRKGEIRTIFNLLFVMLVGGLWHGASWTFVVWGGLHGLYLVVERELSKRFGTPAWTQSLLGQVLLGGFTYFLVNITWVFFRAQDFASAGDLIISMFGGAPNGAEVLPTLGIIKVLVVVGALLVAHWSLRSTRLEDVLERLPGWTNALVWGVMIILLIVTQGGGNAFIYFQF